MIRDFRAGNMIVQLEVNDSPEEDIAIPMQYSAYAYLGGMVGSIGFVIAAFYAWLA